MQTVMTENISMTAWAPGWAKCVEEPERGITQELEQIFGDYGYFHYLIMVIASLVYTYA